jgi:hypothetical protein
VKSYQSRRTRSSCKFAPAVCMLLFQQEFEQWCDMHLTDQQLAEIRGLPLVRLPNSHYHDFIALANAFE